MSTGAIRVLTTNDRGLFSAPALSPDDYELTTECTGFAPVVRSLHLEVGEKLAVEIELKVGAGKEGVQVNATADLLRTTDARDGEVIERQTVQELPVIRRKLVGVGLTVPGSHVGFRGRTG